MVTDEEMVADLAKALGAEWRDGRWTCDSGERPAIVELIIKTSTIGDPCRDAFLMVRYFGSARRWAEGVIERCTVGDPVAAARLMVEHCGSSPEWAAEVERKRNAA